LQFGELQYLLLIYYDLQSSVNLTLLYCTVENRLVLTEINKLALQCKNKLPFPAL